MFLKFVGWQSVLEEEIINLVSNILDFMKDEECNIIQVDNIKYRGNYG